MSETLQAPLTDGQESVYILSRLSKEPVYNMPFAFRLKGDLNLDAFAEAVKTVTRRHNALRANVVETASGFQQVIRPGMETPVLLHDLTAAPGSVQERLLDRAREGFDLAKESPFRVDLFKVSDSEHVVLFCLHHVFGDLSSVRAMLSELSAAYTGADAELPPVEMQFDEFARSRGGQGTENRAIDFWRERLASCPTEFEVPTDKGRPRMPSFKGRLHRFGIPSAVAESMKALARANKCSAYAAYLTAFQALIFRYTGARLFTIATPFSERREAELDNTVGYLVNLLPLPCAPNPEASFKEALAEVRKLTIDAFSNDSVSLRRILQKAGVSAESPKNPLSRIVFQYVSEGPASLALDGLETERIEIHTQTAKFDLDLTIFEHAGATKAEIEYDTDLFEATTIESIAQHFIALLESISANPDEKIGRLNLLTADDRGLLERVNSTASEYPRNATVTELFEAQADATPAKTALVFGDAKLSYSELEARANAWAAALRARGVEPGGTVGVCMERSIELVVALLAILKAGAAFVPIDAKYPKARIDYMLKDAGIRVLISDAKNAGVASGAEVLRAEDLPKAGAARLERLAKAEAPAYVMYTSGSTGEPKGVCVPHRAIVRLVKNNDFMAFRADDVFLLFAPVSFDASTLEIWGALLNGATLAIYEPEFESLDQFARIVQKHSVTNLWLTSGLFSAMADQKLEALRGIRQLLTGGDVVSPQHVRKVYDAIPGITLINGYGPTENTTFTCCCTIPRDWPATTAIPIGKPIRNTTIQVLDAEMQPVPVGVPGELCCGGDGLALGYWNKPEVTAKAFVGGLYRTGDKVRLRRDGIVEFLGRFDDQVKIRGFRIELGEIETALRQVAGVRDASAVIETDSASGKRLLGFVSRAPGADVEGAKIHAEVRERLPEHACPSRIFVVDELPLGPNGKVDRKALLELAKKAPEDARAEEPMNATEAAVAKVWAAVLDRPGVRGDENFFQMGGDSLRAIQAILQINRALNCELTLSQIFEAPTVKGIAKIITNKQQTARPAEAKRPSMPPIRRRQVGSMSDSQVNALLNDLILEKK